tara:strand:- start:363 stop:527 length:165 start_codon:yes stop_codon:yes gene_type:complete
MTNTDLQILMATHKTASDLYVFKIEAFPKADRPNLMRECIIEAQELMKKLRDDN